MDNLYILTKQEFTSLYRFGQIPLDHKKIVKIENLNTEEIELKIYEAFLSLPYFMGDEEYLIVGIDNKLNEDNLLEINTLSEIIPLTKTAQNSYKMKFDTRLDFKEARFENVIHKVEEQIDIQERFQGSKAFWELCRIQEGFNSLLKEELIISAYNKRINSIKSSDFSDDFFIHVLAYDRYEFFPNSDLGFFYDIGEIFAHSKGKPSFTGSNFHSFLEKNKRVLQRKHFLELARIIAESDEITKFTDQLTLNGLRQFIAAAIFLKFKSDLAERETIKGSETGYLVNEISKDNNFIKELNLAVYLTGAFFGYSKFYDDLYDLAGLKIFKTKYKQSQPGTKTSHQKENERINSKIEPTSPKVDNLKVVTAIKKSKESSEKEFSIEEKIVLESLIEMLDKNKNSFEIKTDRLNELKKILNPLSKNKPISKKEEVIQIIRDNFSEKISITLAGKKYFLKKGGEIEFGNT